MGYKDVASQLQWSREAFFLLLWKWFSRFFSRASGTLSSQLVIRLAVDLPGEALLASLPQATQAWAAWPSGKARVCKTLIIGSIPIAASRLNY